MSSGCLLGNCLRTDFEIVFNSCQIKICIMFIIDDLCIIQGMCLNVESGKLVSLCTEGPSSDFKRLP